MPAYLESGYSENKLHSTVDYSKLEKPKSRAHQVMLKKKRALISPLATSPMLAANSTKMTKSISITKWVKQQLGFFHVELGRVFAGLLVGLLGGLVVIPKEKRSLLTGTSPSLPAQGLQASPQVSAEASFHFFQERGRLAGDRFDPGGLARGDHLFGG